LIHFFKRLYYTDKMGKRRKGKNIVEGNTIKGMVSAVSSDEGEADGGDMVYDEVDRWERDKDTAVMAVMMKGRGKRNNYNRKEVFAMSGTDSDSDLELPNIKSLKKKEAEEEIEDSDLGSGEEGEEDARKWGSKKKHYYGGNTGEEIESDVDSEMEEDRAEELEATKLQNQQLARMEEEDFLDTFVVDKTNNEETINKSQATSNLARDLDQLTKKEQAALFKQQSPEFEGIVTDFMTKMEEAVKLARVSVLGKKGEIPAGPQLDYIIDKLQLLLNYCVNIISYIMFKAKGQSLTLHPVTGRLVQYRQLLDSLAPMDEVVMPGLENLLKRLDMGDKVSKLVREERRRADRKREGNKKKKLSLLDKKDSGDQVVPEKKKNKKSKKRKAEVPDALENLATLTQDERMAVELYNVIKKSRNNEDLDDDLDDDGLEESLQTDDVVDQNTTTTNDPEGYDEDGEEKRAITYTIAKNKGLMPKRSKLQRNPRLKNRMKYEKAQKKRKGAVREIRDQKQPYFGEASGINARVKKGVKIL